MLQVKTANDKTWQVDIQKDAILVNEAPFNWDISPYWPQHLSYHKGRPVVYGRTSGRPTTKTKTFTFKINGMKQTVSVRDRFDLLLDKLGMSNANAQKVNDVKAPMPGLILEIKVKPARR